MATRGLGNVFLAMDATYKININKYPVIPIGTVDWDQHYHDVGFCIISEAKENHEHFQFACKKLFRGMKEVHSFTLKGFHLVNMNDNADMIRNGNEEALQSLPDTEQPDGRTELTCYTHLVAPKNGALHKNRGKIKVKEWEPLMKEDLRKLHEVPAGLATYVITILFALLLTKWRNNGETDWASWLSNFWRVRIHWSRAYNQPGLPHHNQGLERANRDLKQILQHKLFHFDIFLNKFISYIRGRSLDEATKTWPNMPRIGAPEWTQAQFYLKKTADSLMCVPSVRRAGAFLYTSGSANEELISETALAEE